MTEKSALERVLSRVDTRHPSGCWLWTGTSTKGYGTTGVDGKRVYVHRFLYEALREPIPTGLDMDHLCRVTLCANPWHVEPVSHRENILRGEHPMVRIHRSWRCSRGHPRSESCLRRGKNGTTRVAYCRTCRREDRAAAKVAAA